MFFFIVGIIFGIPGLIALLVRRVKWNERDRYLGTSTEQSFATWPIGLGVLIFSAALMLLGCLKIVPANSVAIPSTFGKVGAPLEQGPHFALPWTKLNKFTTRVQTSQRLAVEGEGDDRRRDCVEVAAVDGSSMCQDVTTRFTIDKAKAGELFKRWGSFDTVRETLIRRQVDETAKDVLGGYKPEEVVAGENTEKIRNEYTANLRKSLANFGIRLDSVSLGRTHLDPAIQARIDEKIKARQEADRVLIEQKTSLTKAETARKTAEIHAQEVIAKAEGDAKAKVLAAEAEATSNSKVAASLTQELVNYIKALNIGKANQVYVVPEGSTPLVGVK